MNKAPKPVLINVQTTKNLNEENLMKMDLIYYMTTKFSKIGLKTLRKTHPDITFLNVVTDYRELKALKDTPKFKQIAQ